MLYHRILLKLSGESLQGSLHGGIDTFALERFAGEIAEAKKMGIQIGIVVGGGNIFRGLKGSKQGFDRVKGDRMGMLATVINALALSSALDNLNCPNRVMTALRMEPIAEYYNSENAIRYLEQGLVTIFAGGTGNPFFTTDTGSTLRAIEIKADAMLKGTRVDGVYSADPEKDPTATKYDRISFSEVYRLGLKVMDLTATTMCQENNLPVVVFNIEKEGNLARVLSGEPIGTVVSL